MQQRSSGLWYFIVNCAAVSIEHLYRARGRGAGREGASYVAYGTCELTLNCLNSGFFKRHHTKLASDGRRASSSAEYEQLSIVK